MHEIENQYIVCTYQCIEWGQVNWVHSTIYYITQYQYKNTQAHNKTARTTTTTATTTTTTTATTRRNIKWQSMTLELYTYAVHNATAAGTSTQVQWPSTYANKFLGVMCARRVRFGKLWAIRRVWAEVVCAMGFGGCGMSWVMWALCDESRGMFRHRTQHKHSNDEQTHTRKWQHQRNVYIETWNQKTHTHNSSHNA